MNGPREVYTVGHSNRTFEELLSILAEAFIDVLVDVRSYPHSKRHPEHSQEHLAHALPRDHIRYVFEGPDLGGLRKISEGASRHPALESDTFRAYAAHMIEDEGFHRATERVLRLADRHRVALMCAERSPEACHRALLADYLVVRGVRVWHLIDPGSRREHRLHHQLRVVGTDLVYDLGITGSLPGL